MVATDDEEGLSLPGLIARFRQLGAPVTDAPPDRDTWVLTPREGSPMVIGNPTNMSPQERARLLAIVRRRLDPFGSTH